MTKRLGVRLSSDGSFSVGQYPRPEAVSDPQEKCSTLKESRELISELKETLESHKAEANMAPEFDFDPLREASREVDYHYQTREEDAAISL